MVIYYDDVLRRLCDKANKGTINGREYEQLIKLNEWIQNDKSIV